MTAKKDEGPDIAGRIAGSILDALSAIPASAERLSASPRERAREIANKAARTAAMTSGALAFPPGPLGLATILPDLVAVWRIQAQMVADIAGAFGSTALLSRAQMLYCLFRHSAAQAVRDLLVRVGERGLIQRAAARIGVKVSQRALAKGVGRLVPVVGALAVAGYAYYDTAQVAGTAISLFEKAALEKAPSAGGKKPSPRRRPAAIKRTRRPKSVPARKRSARR